ATSRSIPLHHGRRRNRTCPCNRGRSPIRLVLLYLICVVSSDNFRNGLGSSKSQAPNSKRNPVASFGIWKLGFGISANRSVDSRSYLSDPRPRSAFLPALANRLKR